MIYLLDANVPIEANRDYCPIERVPKFWDWLVGLGQEGQVKIPLEIYEEVTVGNDAVANWLRENAAAMLLYEAVASHMSARVIGDGYAPDLTDDEIETLGEYPFLIAYALADPTDRVVVTSEGSKPSRIRANRHVPDVCRGFSIRSINVYRLIRELDFRA